jgi:colanic acid biosynthesis protein WcaH
MTDGFVPDEEWDVIVENVPLVSVDLVVDTPDGVVLGKRTNEPAKGEWFVPGGRVHKHESLTDAVDRVAREELGVSVAIERQLGVYEHFWETTDLDDVGGKHYVTVGYHVTIETGELRPDDQHAALRAFDPPFSDLDLHPYVRAYLDDAGFPVARDDD